MTLKKFKEKVKGFMETLMEKRCYLCCRIKGEKEDWVCLDCHNATVKALQDALVKLAKEVER